MKAEIILLAVAMREEADCVLEILDNVKCVTTGMFDIHTGQSDGGGFVLSRSGPGASRAATAYDFVRTNFIVKRVIVFGLAGAVAPEHGTGTVVIPDRVASADDLADTLALTPAFRAIPGSWTGRVRCGGLAVEVDRPYGREEKNAICHSGAVIVDMESYTLSALARRDNIPVDVIRVVADEADFEMWPEPAGGSATGATKKLSGEVMKKFRKKAAIALDEGGAFLTECLPALVGGRGGALPGCHRVARSGAYR